MSLPSLSARAEIVVDVAAIRHNVRRLMEVVSEGSTTEAPGPQMMVVVKADGYGHGMLPAAQAARQAGATWLGVATIDEAVALREGGDTGRVLCWLGAPGEEYAEAIARDVDVTAYSIPELADIAAAARRIGQVARVQLKVDTGLSRGGAAEHDWPAVAQAARAAQSDGTIEVSGVWSHFACADEPEHPANDAQERVFRWALDVAREAGLTPEGTARIRGI